MNGCKERLLSNVGNEVLKKSMILALPAYAMSCWKLPKGLCMDICKAMEKFWWEDNVKNRKIHWVE